MDLKDISKEELLKVAQQYKKLYQLKCEQVEDMKLILKQGDSV